MSSEFFIPKWEPPPPQDNEEGKARQRTDFQSLMRETEEAMPAPVHEAPRRKPLLRTDFQSLGGREAFRPKSTIPRTWVDWVLDGGTPFLIYTLTLPVLLLLLDMRFVYTEVNDLSLRIFAYCFLMGVVALNRLIARDGSEESIIYMFALAGAVGLYTVCTTGIYGTEVAKNYLNTSIPISLAVNMTAVVFLWWMVNRLTHECCVDENKVAGDVGLFASTARRFQRSLRTETHRPQGPKVKYRTLLEEVQGPRYDLEPYDPLEGYKPPEWMEAKKERAAKLNMQVPKYHPGISIFYFSVPALLIFSLGLRLIQHGGEPMLRNGWRYLLLYLSSALLLLLFTSLGGLREYYRQKHITLPAGVGGFWLALGLLMTAMVIVGAMRFPLPPMPPLAYVQGHEFDPLSDRPRDFVLKQVDVSPDDIIAESAFLENAGNLVLGVLVLFALYAAIKGVAAFAAALARRRERLPRFLVSFFDRLERFLSSLTRLPVLPKRRRSIRVQRDIATSMRYANPTTGDRPMPLRAQVEYAYAALCALAYDLGVPRELSQTPFEFLNAFPVELETLREDGEMLTRLYLIAAYSPIEIDESVGDRLRRFWINYNRIRNRVVY